MSIDDIRRSGSRALKLSPRIVTLDVIFRGLLGAAFVWMIVSAMDMPQSSFGNPAAYPLFVGIMGMVLWIAANINEVGQRLRGGKQGRIYDIAFETEGISRVTVWLRTAWVFGIMVGATIGVSLVNFHITIPLFLIAYLRFIGKMKWRWVLLIAFLIEIPIVVLYGTVINTGWPQSLIERVFDFDMQDAFEYVTPFV